MPPFGPEETTREEVVLYRVLRGCGAERPSFIDLATALEAALLPRTTTELTYRFRLYGALFLAPEHDPEETVAQLKDVYKVRSDLVHGTPVRAERLRGAEATARTLSTAVALKAIETGWPSPEALDELALRM
jgi:Apea-like HEPN